MQAECLVITTSWRVSFRAGKACRSICCSAARARCCPLPEVEGEGCGWEAGRAVWRGLCAICDERAVDGCRLRRSRGRYDVYHMHRFSDVKRAIRHRAPRRRINDATEEIRSSSECGRDSSGASETVSASRHGDLRIGVGAAGSARDIRCRSITDLRGRRWDEERAVGERQNRARR